MEQTVKQRWALQHVLAAMGGLFAFVGVCLVILAAALSIISFEKFQDSARFMIHLGPVLFLSGASAALYFITWIPMPRTGSDWAPTSERRVQLVQWGIFLFNVVTGVMLLGGLLIGWVGFYWISSVQVGRRGFAVYVVGVVLVLIKLSVLKRVIVISPPDNQQ